MEKVAARIKWNSPNLQLSGVSLPVQFWKRQQNPTTSEDLEDLAKIEQYNSFEAGLSYIA